MQTSTDGLNGYVSHCCSKGLRILVLLLDSLVILTEIAVCISIFTSTGPSPASGGKLMDDHLLSSSDGDDTSERLMINNTALQTC